MSVEAAHAKRLLARLLFYFAPAWGVLGFATAQPQPAFEHLKLNHGSFLILGESKIP
jgi:hypothetical protein